MPELPEVEVILRQLQPLVVGCTITNLEVRRADYVRNSSAIELEQRLKGETISALRRHGKVLLFDMRRGGTLAIRLGMTGKVLLQEHDDPFQKHTHWVMRMQGQEVELRGVDPRRFGKLLWLKDGIIPDIGPDALLITAAELATRLSSHNIAIHKALLDQKLLAGVGNIYACEALHAVGLNPMCPANLLKKNELEELLRVLQRIMRDAITDGGSTIADYVDSSGKAGSFAQKHRVYGKTDKVCPRCGTRIVRTSRGGRSIFYCPCCQTGGGTV